MRAALWVALAGLLAGCNGGVATNAAPTSSTGTTTAVATGGAQPTSTTTGGGGAGGAQGGGGSSPCDSGACAPVKIASSQDVAALALDATYVYWAGVSDARIQRVKRSTPASPPETLCQLPSNPYDLALGGKLLWAAGDLKLRAASTETGAVTTPSLDLVLTVRVAADAAHAYAAQAKAGGWAIVSASVLGPTTTLATYDVPAFNPVYNELGFGYLGVSGDALVAALEGTHDDGGEYLQSDGAVLSVNLGTGQKTKLATGVRRPTLAVTDGVSAFWAQEEAGVGGSVWKAPVAGGAAARLLDTPKRLKALRVSGDALWYASADGKLRRLRLAPGETPSQIATGLASYALAVDDAGVAYATSGPGGDRDASIWLLAK